MKDARMLWVAYGLICDENTEKRDAFPTPEHINNSIETAPSKRILHLIPNYSKTRQGVLIAKNIGIDRMFSECKHFAAWVEKIRKACL